MIKKFYLTYRWDPNWYDHSGSVDLGVMAMKGYSTFPKVLVLELQHQMVCVMSRTPIDSGFSPSTKMQSVYSIALTDKVGLQIICIPQDHKPKKKPLRKHQNKNVNKNVQWIRFPYL